MSNTLRELDNTKVDTDVSDSLCDKSYTSTGVFAKLSKESLSQAVYTHYKVITPQCNVRYFNQW